MAITISNGELEPALTYNRFFLASLNLVQKASSLESSVPIYALKVEYRLYAVDASGVRHFKNKLDSFEIEDYVQEATAKAAQGDFDLLTAMQAIEVALASIIEDQTALGATTVS